MRNWLSRWFGRGHVANPPERAERSVVRDTVSKPAASAAAVTAGQPIRELADREVAFLAGLKEPPILEAIEQLSQDDRTFVAGVNRRLRTRELELPVLPEMALRLSRMFRDGVAVGEFVKLINSDASLAVEVLKTANSAFYAGSSPLTSLQDAIVRIGLDRLQSVLMIAHLRGKVLKAGAFQREADLLLEMAPPIGQLASKLAHGREHARETCFVRGALLHVEHLVILGAIGAVARDAKRTIVPSPRAMHYAFVKSGRPIREALAKEWNLRDLLFGGEAEAAVPEEYELIRSVLISRWLRLPMPDAASTLPDVQTAIADIAPRVAPPSEPAKLTA